MRYFKLLLLGLSLLVSCSGNVNDKSTKSGGTIISCKVYENCAWSVNKQGCLEISYLEEHIDKKTGEVVVDLEKNWTLTCDNCLVVYQTMYVATLYNELYEQVWTSGSNTYTLVVYERNL